MLSSTRLLLFSAAVAVTFEAGELDALFDFCFSVASAVAVTFEAGELDALLDFCFLVASAVAVTFEVLRHGCSLRSSLFRS